jgi:NAD(P)-dependent dehydrogenase (short-subunit alcohol dehydrogenase family)
VSGRVDRIDALVLNAGLIRADVDAGTVDGYEPTFAVNHLAHYLLLRLLLDRLADGARVVQTTSGTHDPAERSGFPAP